jgi:hypothetical protein
MPGPEIANTTGAYGLTTLNQTAMREVWEAPAETALITAGDVLVWTGQTTDDNPTVDQSATGDDPALQAGIALNVAAAGGIVHFVRSGPALANIGAGNSSTAAQLGQRSSAAAGVVTSAAGDGDSVVGDYIGVFLGAEIGSTNQSVLDVAKM